MTKQSVRADQIKHALSQKHAKDIFFTECKTGATWSNDGLLKFDALAIKQSWASPSFTGYEVKVSRQDFQRDDKWPGYKNFCHRLSFVCPTNLIKPEELPDDVGLIYFNPQTGSLYTKRAAKFREIEITVPMLYYILISRMENDRHPFFSTQREMLEAFMEDKASRRDLGYNVRSKMMQGMIAAQEEVEAIKRHTDRIRDKAERFDHFNNLIHKLCGFYLTWWNSEERLTKALAGGMSGEMQDELQKIINASEKLSEMMKVASSANLEAI